MPCLRISAGRNVSSRLLQPRLLHRRLLAQRAEWMLVSELRRRARRDEQQQQGAARQGRRAGRGFPTSHFVIHTITSRRDLGRQLMPPSYSR